uniref:Laminin IV type A domain-containing protein n=1 Tax=Anopheles atroparvus TaxID=41427 RepID=A0A182IYS8_ANOAO
MRRCLVIAIFALLHWTGAHGRWMRPGEILQDPRSMEVEDDAGQHSEVILFEGRKLMLTFEDRTNRRVAFTRWYHNGLPISERTRRGCYVTFDKMVCSEVARQDEGRYELWGSDRTGQRYLIQSANVRVIPQPMQPPVSEPVARVMAEVEPVPAPTPRYHDDCFCSGVTSRCRMANNLYRMQIPFNLSNAEPVDYLTPTARREEQHVAIPGTVWGGNLITAYGGYLRLPVTNECYRDRSEPCMVLVDKYGQAIGYYLSPLHDQRELSVLMKEASWRLLKTPGESESEPSPRTTQQLDKFTFMFVLSNIETAYVRGRYGSFENTVLTIDLATPYDKGLGTVRTVEECFCHEGYAGLSCERCDSGYRRFTEVINSNGVCISNQDLWHFMKQKYNV